MIIRPDAKVSKVMLKGHALENDNLTCSRSGWLSFLSI